jgi:hypothetical protein
MSVHFSVIGITLAVISSIIVGMFWYNSAVFGKRWMKIVGLSEADMKKGMARIMPGVILVALITAYVLSIFIAYTHGYLGGSWLRAGFVSSLLAWVGFAATTVFAHGLFEPRDKKVLYINAGNRLVTLVAMGLILGAFMK